MALVNDFIGQANAEEVKVLDRVVSGLRDPRKQGIKEAVEDLAARVPAADPRFSDRPDAPAAPLATGYRVRSARS